MPNIAETLVGYFKLMEAIQDELRGVLPHVSPMEGAILYWVDGQKTRCKDITTLFGSTGKYAVAKLGKRGLLKLSSDGYDMRQKFAETTSKAAPIVAAIRRLDNRRVSAKEPRS